MCASMHALLQACSSCCSLAAMQTSSQALRWLGTRHSWLQRQAVRRRATQQTGAIQHRACTNNAQWPQRQHCVAAHGTSSTHAAGLRSNHAALTYQHQLASLLTKMHGGRHPSATRMQALRSASHALRMCVMAALPHWQGSTDDSHIPQGHLASRISTEHALVQSIAAAKEVLPLLHTVLAACSEAPRVSKFALHHLAAIMDSLACLSGCGPAQASELQLAAGIPMPHILSARPEQRSDVHNAVLLAPAEVAPLAVVSAALLRQWLVRTVAWHVQHTQQADATTGDAESVLPILSSFARLPQSTVLQESRAVVLVKGVTLNLLVPCKQAGRFVLSDTPLVSAVLCKLPCVRRTMHMLQ